MDHLQVDQVENGVLSARNPRMQQNSAGANARLGHRSETCRYKNKSEEAKKLNAKEEEEKILKAKKAVQGLGAGSSKKISHSPVFAYQCTKQCRR